MIYFIQNDQVYILLDEETGRLIPNVRWGDPTSGRYEVYLTYGHGNVFFPTRTAVRRGRIRLLRFVRDEDFQLSVGTGSLRPPRSLEKDVQSPPFGTLN